MTDDRASEEHIEHEKAAWPGQDGRPAPPVVLAVCGKGGVGKTAFSALLSRIFIESGVAPLLLVDADPVAGLLGAIGESTVDTLAGVRERFIATVRQGGRDAAVEAAQLLDYALLEALVERDSYALLAMGHNAGKGCFCPANRLLRSALERLLPSFSAVLLDAEAGIEQIRRDITEHVTCVIAVVDASKRSLDTLRRIADEVGPSRVAVVVNRTPSPKGVPGAEPPPAPERLLLPEGVTWLGVVPEDDELRRFDQDGRSLWDLPADNPAVIAVREIAGALQRHLAHDPREARPCQVPSPS